MPDGLPADSTATQERTRPDVRPAWGGAAFGPPELLQSDVPGSRVVKDSRPAERQKVNPQKSDVNSEPAVYPEVPLPTGGEKPTETMADVAEELKAAVALLVSDQCADTAPSFRIQAEEIVLATLSVARQGDRDKLNNIYQTARAEVASATPKLTKLSERDAAEFKACAELNQWSEDHGMRPAAFIAQTFKQWLGRGLGLTDVRKTQPNLARAYSTEVSRNPAHRVPDLYVRPHTLPSGAPPRFRTERRIEELTDEEKERRRAAERVRQARRAAKLKESMKAPGP